jgi:osmotically inducible protein OsmC
MPIAERAAETVWEGPLGSGWGTVRPATGAFNVLAVTWPSRTGPAEGVTSPEELVAAAHSACFAMALARQLGARQAVPEMLAVTATVTLDEAGGVPTITSSALQVRGRVPGLSASGFQAAVEEAAAVCPVSRLFAGANISVVAALEPGT